MRAARVHALVGGILCAASRILCHTYSCTAPSLFQPQRPTTGAAECVLPHMPGPLFRVRPAARVQVHRPAESRSSQRSAAMATITLTCTGYDSLDSVAFDSPEAFVQRLLAVVRVKEELADAPVRLQRAGRSPQQPLVG